MKRLIKYFICFFTFILTSNIVLAENFYIKNYNVYMNVNKNKTVEITEDIDVYFTKSSHGIYREIPLRVDEDIYEISVTGGMTVISEQENLCSIKIGDSDRYINGDYNYKIKYTHKVSGANNEFYYNIIGTKWDVPIEHASFEVHMPEEFDPSKVGLSIGRYGTKGFKDGALYSINGKIISGRTTNKILKPREGITLRVELPDNYFSLKKNMMQYCVFLLMIILTGISFFVWLYIGKDEHVTPVVSFYPPEKFNSAQVQLIYDGRVYTSGLVSLIIWLANQGYIEISSTDDGHFRFHKKQNLTNECKDPIVKDFVSALFNTNDEITDEELVKSTFFYKKCEECIDKYNEKYQVFEENSISLKMIALMLMCLLGAFLSELYILFGQSFLTMLPLVLMFLVIICLFVLGLEISSILVTIVSLIFGGYLALLLKKCIINSNETISFGIVGIICIIITYICLRELPKRTRAANQVYGEILGFKKFLETVELKRVESLVATNPNYCFEVLPYLYVFDLTDKWINQFEKFFVQSPEWYSGNHFSRNFDRIMSSTIRYASPSVENGGISESSSRSSDGGGGFSGGGHGGGGGRSW